jgi:O-antigen/teichoic acid export membrane protein
MSSVIGVPVFVYCLAAAPELVEVVFGHRWVDSVPVMRLLCLFGALQVVMQFNSALLQAAGRVRLVFRVGLLSTLLQVAAFAAAVPHGISWVAASIVVRSCLLMPVWLIATARCLEDSAWSTVRDVTGPVLSAAVMLGAIFAVRPEVTGLHQGLQLVVLTVVGGIVYPVALLVCARSTLKEALTYARLLVPTRRVDASAG